MEDICSITIENPGTDEEYLVIIALEHFKPDQYKLVKITQGGEKIREYDLPDLRGNFELSPFARAGNDESFIIAVGETIHLYTHPCRDNNIRTQKNKMLLTRSLNLTEAIWEEGDKPHLEPKTKSIL